MYKKGNIIHFSLSMPQNYYKYKVENLISIDSIVTLHNFDLEKDFIAEPEKHDFYEFVFVKKGSIIAKQDDNEISLEQNQIIFHKPNIMHSIVATNDTAPSVLIVSFSSKSEEMHFFDNKVFDLTKGVIQILDIIFDLGSKTFDIDNTTPTTTKMHLKENAIIGGIQSIKNMLEFFLIELIKNESNREENIGLFLSGNNLIDNVIYYLKSNVYTRVDIEDISNRFGYSKSYIFKEFKRKTGNTIINYFTRLKIDEAKRLLKKKENNISQVSNLLAFDNPNYFSKVFNKIAKMTPSQYKAKYNII